MKMQDSLYKGLLLLSPQHLYPLALSNTADPTTPPRDLTLQAQSWHPSLRTFLHPITGLKMGTATVGPGSNYNGCEPRLLLAGCERVSNCSRSYSLPSWDLI